MPSPQRTMLEPFGPPLPIAELVTERKELVQRLARGCRLVWSRRCSFFRSYFAGRLLLRRAKVVPHLASRCPVDGANWLAGWRVAPAHT